MISDVIQHKECTVWHHRLGHPSLGSFLHLSIQFGFQLNKESYQFYDVCRWETQTQNSFPNGNFKAQRPFSLIHCDSWGPYHARSLSGCYYFLRIVDDFNCAVWVYLFKDKSKACEKLISFCAMVKTLYDMSRKFVVIIEPSLPKDLCKLSLLCKRCFMKHLASTHHNEMDVLNRKIHISLMWLVL